MAAIKAAQEIRSLLRMNHSVLDWWEWSEWVCIFCIGSRELDYPCKTIAVETTSNNDRLGWCRPGSSLLIGGHGETPATLTEAQGMGSDRKSDIAKLVSGLNVVFLLTGLNGISGKGLAVAVAETLDESGVFTIAIVPGRCRAS